MSSSFKASFIASILDGELVGEDMEVHDFKSLKSANRNSISFFIDQKFKSDLINTKASIVILKKKDSYLRDSASIIVKDPYLAFAKISSLFVKKKSPFKHESAFISTTAKIGLNFSIGAFSSIGNEVEVDDNVFIGANSSIGDYVVIGSNTTIHSNVTIEPNVYIGKNCEIYSGARIGTSGFGYARDNDGTWLNIPQVGSVKIGNNVDIGANTTIDRGAIEDTVIYDGVKIDNLVQIGHNCIIGENSIIAGCTGIAGSAIIEKNCMIGGAAMIKGHIKIADDTIISGGTGIGKNVDDPGKRFTNVFPYNIEHKDWLRIANNLKKMGKKND